MNKIIESDKFYHHSPDPPQSQHQPADDRTTGDRTRENPISVYRTERLACTLCVKWQCDTCGLEAAKCLYAGTDWEYGRICLFCRLQSVIRLYCLGRPWPSQESVVKAARAHAGVVVTEWQAVMQEKHSKDYTDAAFSDCMSDALKLSGNSSQMLTL